MDNNNNNNSSNNNNMNKDKLPYSYISLISLIFFFIVAFNVLFAILGGDGLYIDWYRAIPLIISLLLAIISLKIYNDKLSNFLIIGNLIAGFIYSLVYIVLFFILMLIFLL